MVFKRVGAWLGVACLAAALGVAGGSASAAENDSAGGQPKTYAVVTFKSGKATSGDVGIQTRCEITSRDGHFYQQMWCETQAVWISWYWWNGSLLGHDDLLIDVFGPVMRDNGGWTQLQGGVAINTRPGNEVGIFILNSTGPIKVAVIGTDNQRWCNSSASPWVWSGWSHC